MKIIVAPIDFSPATERIVAVVESLARVLPAYVVLLHVVRENGSRLTAAATERADEQLAQLKSGLREKGITIQTMRLTGHPAMKIVAHTEKLRANLIVMGSRGHTALHHFVVGSTAGSVLRAASCPVMIVPTEPSRPSPQFQEAQVVERTALETQMSLVASHP